MFSNNDKISPRQIKRLLIFDLFGISSLLLPAQLAQAEGSSGLWGIFAGTILSGCYLWLLHACRRHMPQDYLAYLQSGWGRHFARVLYLCYAAICILISGWTAKTLSELVCSSLLDASQFPTALLLLMLLALYGASAGIEARARIYEILFWVLAAPLIIMLLLCLRQVQFIQWFPLMPKAWRQSGWSGLWNACLKCFASFMPLTLLLFLKPHEQDEAKTGRAAAGALMISGTAVAAVYLILTGTFDSGALAGEQYPIITLMGMVKIPGDFIKRLDTLMIGVWFLTLYALAAAALYYGVSIARSASASAQGRLNAKTMVQNCWLCAAAALVYGTAYSFYMHPQAEILAVRLFYLAGMPFLISIPLLSLFLYRVRGRMPEKKPQESEKEE